MSESRIATDYGIARIKISGIGGIRLIGDWLFIWCGCLNQDGQDKRIFKDLLYPVLSFYLGYLDSELFAFLGVNVYNENIHLTNLIGGELWNRH